MARDTYRWIDGAGFCPHEYRINGVDGKELCSIEERFDIDVDVELNHILIERQAQRERRQHTGSFLHGADRAHYFKMHDPWALD